MNRIPVISTNVSSIGYYNGMIEVEFNNGSIYHYYGTTEILFNQFLNAPSKGRFIHYNLKGFNYRKVA